MFYRQIALSISVRFVDVGFQTCHKIPVQIALVKLKEEIHIDKCDNHRLVVVVALHILSFLLAIILVF